MPAPLRRRGSSIGPGGCHSPGDRGGAEVCRRARGGVRCAARRRAQGERSVPGLAVQRRAACDPIGCRCCAPPSSPLRQGVRGRISFPARAALAGVVWEEVKKVLELRRTSAPLGGAGRSQTDRPGISCVWLFGVSVCERACVCVCPGRVSPSP